MMIDKIQPSRRTFLAGSAGLVVGFYLAPLGRAAADTLHQLVVVHADGSPQASDFAASLIAARTRA